MHTTAAEGCPVQLCCMRSVTEGPQRCAAEGCTECVVILRQLETVLRIVTSAKPAGEPEGRQGAH